MLERKFAEAAEGTSDDEENSDDYRVIGLFQTLAMVLKLLTSDLAGAEFKAVVDYFEVWPLSQLAYVKASSQCSKQL